MNTVYLLSGLPGSGKSSFSEIASSILDAVVVSVDKIRYENQKESYTYALKLANQVVIENLVRGENVILDSCYMEKEERAEVISALQNEAILVSIYFNVHIVICKCRNLARNMPIEDSAYDRLLSTCVPPCITEGFDRIVTVENITEKEYRAYISRKDKALINATINSRSIDIEDTNIKREMKKIKKIASIVKRNDPTIRFNGFAKIYSNGRLDYSEEFILDLYSKYGVKKGSRIADIGSGTGKLSKQLLEKGYFVYCVEPNKEMLSISQKELASFENVAYVNGVAENNSLSDCSIDYIMVAQAFHWFDVIKFKKECRRCLKPNGKVFLIWNNCSYETVPKSRNVLGKICNALFNIKTKYINKIVLKDIEFLFNNQYETMEYVRLVHVDRSKFIQMVLSYPYSYGNIISKDFEKLGKLFDRFSKNGYITLSNKTVVYIGKCD